jgi:hypothetical protein
MRQDTARHLQVSLRDISADSELISADYRQKAQDARSCAFFIALPMEIRFDSNGGDHMETPQKDVNRWISEVKNMPD